MHAPLAAATGSRLIRITATSTLISSDSALTYPFLLSSSLCFPRSSPSPPQYITHFEQLLERDQGLMAEIFARCRSIYKALYNGPPDGHNLARTVLAAGGGFVAGIDTKAVAAGYTHMSEGERQELLQMYHVGHINREFHVPDS